MAHRWVYAEGSLHYKHLQSPNLRAAIGQRDFISHRFCMHCLIRDKECEKVDKNSRTQTRYLIYRQNVVKVARVHAPSLPLGLGNHALHLVARHLLPESSKLESHIPDLCMPNVILRAINRATAQALLKGLDVQGS